MLFPYLQVDSAPKESFINFQQDALNNFKVNVRRTRAAQLRELLSQFEAIDLETFQREAWNFETETYLRSHNLYFSLFSAGKQLWPSVEQLLEQKKVTLSELESALASNNLELHGNYIWHQGAGLYAPGKKSEQDKLNDIHRALHILNDKSLSPLQKAERIKDIYGFGENNATGLVMIFHPDEFALVNPVSRGSLKKLGMNITNSVPLERIQQSLYELKEILGAKDFLELDWFLYLCSKGEYPLGDSETDISPKTNKSWFQHVKSVLEEEGRPLHVSEITERVLTRGIQTVGKTPERTVSRTLTTNTHIFERVSEGMYQLKQTATEKELISSPSHEYVEPEFDTVYRAVVEQGLRIDERTVRRYFLSLKTRGFVILSGPSGTGKTWLTEAYASALEARYLLVPVAPNWTTNEDLLGYVDPLNNALYHHTPFSSFLEAAAQEYEQAVSEGRKSRPYHIVLDEMNLARIEYYFAKFLSAMEVRARQEIAAIDLGAQKQIYLYRNLFFIGTINVDETTQGFSDKVFDRVQLIELPISRDALEEHLSNAEYREVLLKVWDAVHEIAPFAFRVLTEIEAYVNEAKLLGISWEEALDEQILQKILPRCKGMDTKVEYALKELLGVLPIEYSLSRQKIQDMITRFELHGIASYF